jgi:hypothetical protein
VTAVKCTTNSSQTQCGGISPTDFFHDHPHTLGTPTTRFFTPFSRQNF